MHHGTHSAERGEPSFFATAATMRRSAVHSVAFSSSLILFECVYIRAAEGFGHATRAKRIHPTLLIVDSRELAEHVLKRSETKKRKRVSPMNTNEKKLFTEN